MRVASFVALVALVAAVDAIALVAAVDAIAFDVETVWPKQSVPNDYFANLRAGLDRVTEFYARENLTVTWNWSGKTRDVQFPCFVPFRNFDPRHFFRKFQTYEGQPFVVVIPDCPSAVRALGVAYGRSVWVRYSKFEAVDVFAKTLAHEVGHALGLPHADWGTLKRGDPHSIMGGFAGPLSAARLTIAERDLLGFAPPELGLGTSTRESFRTTSPRERWTGEFVDGWLRMYRASELRVDTNRTFARVSAGGVTFADGYARRVA